MENQNAKNKKYLFHYFFFKCNSFCRDGDSVNNKRGETKLVAVNLHNNFVEFRKLTRPVQKGDRTKFEIPVLY